MFDWDLSSADHVLKPNLVDTPKYTQKLETGISAWTQAIEDMVCHEAILPKDVDYADVCVRLVVVARTQIIERFSRYRPTSLLSVLST